MGDSRSLSRFGHLDLEVEHDPERTLARAELPTSEARLAVKESTGVLLRTIPEVTSASSTRPPPSSGARLPETAPPPEHADATRMASLDAELVRRSRPSSQMRAPHDDAATTALPPPMTSGRAAKASVAALRELYASGDVDGALQLAARLTEHPEARLSEPPEFVDIDQSDALDESEPGASFGDAFDDPMAGFVIALDEPVPFDPRAEPPEEDPFGGLIPLEEEKPEHSTDDMATRPPGGDGGAPIDLGALIAATMSSFEDGSGVRVIDGLGASIDMDAVLAVGATSNLHTKIPRVKKSPGEIAKLPIDHRAGFLLAHIDGMQSVEEILDICAMPESEALELIEKLEKLGVIEMS